MRLIAYIAYCSLLVASQVADAQVKDRDGNDLRVGLPTKPTADYDGGTITRGRPAMCALDTKAPRVCTFYARNGNGGFAIDVDGLAYYADKVSTNSVDVDYDNGARMVPQGTFVRSKRDPACWLRAPSRKICVY